MKNKKSTSFLKKLLKINSLWLSQVLRLYVCISQCGLCHNLGAPHLITHTSSPAAGTFFFFPSCSPALPCFITSSTSCCKFRALNTPSYSPHSPPTHTQKYTAPQHGHASLWQHDTLQGHKKRSCTTRPVRLSSCLYHPLGSCWWWW